MAIADQISNYVHVVMGELKCDKAFVNFQNDEVLHSLGNIPLGEAPEFQSFILSDTLCAHTLFSRKPLMLADSTTSEKYKDTEYVKSGAIVGYLGVPIANEEIGTIGTLCAITTQPREWKPIEKQLLIGLASCIELSIQRELHKVSADILSQTLTEQDKLLITLMNEMQEAIAVYNSKRELVFASNALAERVSYKSISSFKENASQAFDECDAAANSGKDPIFRVEDYEIGIKQTTSGHYISTWKKAPVLLH